MKKFFIFILACAAVNSVPAQSGFGQQWDSLYWYLRDAGDLQTGIFWDLALPDTALGIYGGQSGAPESDFTRWINLYGTVENASLKPGTGSLLPHSLLSTKLSGVMGTGVVPVPVLDVKGGKIRPAAFADGSLTFDHTLGAWIPQTGSDKLFEPLSVFMAAPYVHTVYRRELKLLFSNDMLYGNTGRHIVRVLYRINGMPQAATEPGKQIIAVLAEGDNAVELIFEMSDGMRLESRFTMAYDTRDLTGGVPDKALATGPFHFGDQYGNIYAAPLRPGEFANKPCGAFIDYLPGQTGGISHTCIQKPLIIVEGIDFGFDFKPTDCYGGKCGSMGLIDLMNGYMLNPHVSRFVNNREEWAAIRKAPEMLRRFRESGYDIFYIDFHNGADYMENNAMLVVEFIKMLNQRKCSREEIAVVGTSMGGVVARFALNYMEKNRIPHCVRTFVSFDAPQQGANIPLGLQSFLQYYKGKLPAVKRNFDQKINRPATRQLLLYHCLSPYQSRPHQDRHDFMAALNALGTYPKLSRNIAIANGSVDRSLQIFNPGDLLLTMKTILNEKLPKPLQIWANVYAMAKPGPDGEMLVMEAKVYTDHREEIKYVDKGTRFMDHEAGSIRYDLRDFRKILLAFNIVNRHSASCFIPTTSALDMHEKDSVAVIQEILKPEGLQTEHYPFEAYTGARSTNQEHMEITDENTVWCLEQIEMNRNEMPVQLSGYYNFARQQRRMLNSVTVQNGGKLHINSSGIGGNGMSPYDRAPEPGSAFEAYTSDCAPLINVESGGMLSIGDQNSPKVNTAVLRLRSGSVLQIKEGGKLHIHNGSRLIVEEGAELLYAKGASIVLDGSDAVLQVEGKVKLGAGAVFTVSKGSNGKTGYILLRSPQKHKSAVLIESVGKDASIELNGSGKHSSILLQVEGLAELWNPALGVNPVSLKLSNGKIRYASRSGISASGNLTVDGVVFELLPKTGNGTSDALVMHNSTQVQVRESEFHKLRFGLKINRASAGTALLLSNNLFSQCATGLSAAACNADIKHTVFRACGITGLLLEEPHTLVSLDNLSFQDNFTGMELRNSASDLIPVIALNCEFIRNVTGLNTARAELSLQCNRFSGNGTALADYLGALNLSADRELIYGQMRIKGGNNTFAYNSVSGLLLKGSTLYLENGDNNFILPESQTARIITGEMAYSTQTHESYSPYMYKAGGNFWSRVPQGGLPAGSGNLYYVKFPYPGTQGSTENKFSGLCLSQLNRVCYVQPGNVSDFVVDAGASAQGITPFGADSLLVTVFPHPANTHLDIRIVGGNEANGSCTVALYAADGKKVYELENQSEACHIHTAELAEGLYLLVVSKGSVALSRKVYVRH